MKTAMHYVRCSMSTVKDRSRHFLTGCGTYSSSSLALFLGSVAVTEIFRDSFRESFAVDISPAAATASDFVCGTFTAVFSVKLSSSNSSVRTNKKMADRLFADVCLWLWTVLLASLHLTLLNAHLSD